MWGPGPKGGYSIQKRCTAKRLGTKHGSLEEAKKTIIV